ncbi:protein RRNAD1 [Ixodes scapularis]
MEVLPQVSLVKYTCGKCNYDQGPFVHSENQAFKSGSCPECRSLGPFKIKIKQCCPRCIQADTSWAKLRPDIVSRVTENYPSECFPRCEYNTSTRNQGKPVGYPMSRHILSLGERARLSYQAREVACHALEAYLSRLREEPSLLKIHCYRALLETVIVRNYADLKHSGLGSVKRAAAMTFAEYARKALRKFPLPISEEDLNAPELESLLKEWKRVVLFYSLRLLLAPVVESLVLTDRALYLSEHGISSCLVPLFDPNLSPRNIVLLAFKGGS